MRLDDKVCITTYFNDFGGKMGYQLKDKDPRTLRDAFRIIVNIENNMRISSKLGIREMTLGCLGVEVTKKGK